MDLYDILEINPNATENEIKKSYLHLVKLYHPDKNKLPNAVEHFQQIQTAYEILINPITREEYHKMTPTKQLNFMDMLNKIIKENIDVFDLDDINHFIKTFNIADILSLFINPDATTDIFNINEKQPQYYYELPEYYNKINKLDIKLNLTINLSDIINNRKREIKIKRNINDEEITTTFIINLSKPYIIFINGGDIYNEEYGNLIIKLHLQNSLVWDNKYILLEHQMTIYELIYGLDIYINIDENENIDIKQWIPIRDGFIINVSSYNLSIKLFLDYNTTSEKEQLLKSLC
jgi:curved DNA-binding protein CbpA